MKDDSAQVRAVLWKSAAKRLVFDLTDGLAVRAWGALTVYPPRGEYQLVVERLEPKGIGALELALRQLKETRRLVRSSPSAHPASTPAVQVRARSLLENGIVRAKSQCGQFIRTQTDGLYVNYTEVHRSRNPSG